MEKAPPLSGRGFVVCFGDGLVGCSEGLVVMAGCL